MPLFCSFLPKINSFGRTTSVNWHVRNSRLNNWIHWREKVGHIYSSLCAPKARKIKIWSLILITSLLGRIGRICVKHIHLFPYKIGVNLSHNTECINICSKTRKHITRDWIQNENSVLKWILNIVVMGLTLSSICSYIPTAFYISCNIKFRSTINFKLVKIYLDQQPILHIGLTIKHSVWWSKDL